MLLKQGPVSRLTSFKPFKPIWPYNSPNNDRSGNIIIWFLQFILVCSLWNLIDLKAILPIPQNLDFKVTAVLRCRLLRMVNVWSVVVDLSRGNHPKIFAEVIIVHEESTITGVLMESNPLFLVLWNGVPAGIVVIPGCIRLGFSPGVAELNETVDAAVCV